jgi:hypothetical protein
MVTRFSGEDIRQDVTFAASDVRFWYLALGFLTIYGYGHTRLHDQKGAFNFPV